MEEGRKGGREEEEGRRKEAKKGGWEGGKEGKVKKKFGINTCQFYYVQKLFDNVLFNAV
jgi:hypothetical protein